MPLQVSRTSNILRERRSFSVHSDMRGGCKHAALTMPKRRPSIVARYFASLNQCRSKSGRNTVGRGRNASTAGPDRGSARTGTAGLSGPCPTSATRPKVLDGLVPGCNTAAAPPSSARCRVRHGRSPPSKWTVVAPDLIRHRRVLYSARLAIWRRRPISSSRTRSAGRRSNSRSRERMP